MGSECHRSNDVIGTGGAEGFAVKGDSNMAQQLRFDDETEDLVGLIEQTKPDEIIAETYTRLSKGESKERLLAAAALAVSRSTVLPASHHGGPVHPVSGIYSVEALSKRNFGEKGFFPVIQSVALANKHIHSPSMGPNILVHLILLSLGRWMMKVCWLVFRRP